jgi:hypothetical protein
VAKWFDIIPFGSTINYNLFVIEPLYLPRLEWKIMLIIFGGLPGNRKTTFAHKLAERIEAVYFLLLFNECF